MVYCVLPVSTNCPYVQSVHVACIGEGPVVHVLPLELDWGVVPVLHNKPKTILLSNESLIPARFTAHMVCHMDFFV